jgi:1,5-anhydro-D-fructose reductase (1,5-anhydro-D-mannitol-forming)
MVRFGILGFGLHAEKRLVEGFRGARQAKLMALSRRDAARARKTAQTHGIPHAFGSAEELCRCPDVDAIFIATPNCCHCNDTLLALRYHKPVLCEKPMAMNAAECRQMVDAARAAGLLLGVAQVFRFTNSILRLRERVAAGEIGGPISARAEFSFLGKDHARTWLYDRTIAGGGALADIGVHCIDALRFVLQDEVVAVGARGVFDMQSRDVEASAAALLQFARGTLGTVTVSMRSAYRTTVEIVGEKGVVRANPALSLEEPVRVELWRDGEVIDSERLFNSDSFARMLDAFAIAVEGKKPFICPGEEGLKNQLILDQAYAHLTGK